MPTVKKDEEGDIEDLVNTTSKLAISTTHKGGNLNDSGLNESINTSVVYSVDDSSDEE